MATHIFECRMLDGHLLANINGRAVVIDTGSESSYWRHLDNGHEALELQGEPMPYELADALERNVAPRLFGLMGMDNLRQFDVTISLSERTMSLHRESFFMPGAWSVPVEISHGSIPVIRRVGINGQARDVKFDLGARFSYLEFTGMLP